MAQDGLDEDMSVIVIMNYEDSIQALTKRLNTSNTITGKDEHSIRQQLIDAFNADDEQLLVMNIKAGGLGISLHGTSKSRTRLVLISPTPSGIDLKQALGRAHRAGGARSIQKIVWAANTIEEPLCKKVALVTKGQHF
jgi:SNF2 family DNA or RNA helicase